MIKQQVVGFKGCWVFGITALVDPQEQTPDEENLIIHVSSHSAMLVIRPVPNYKGTLSQIYNQDYQSLHKANARGLGQDRQRQHEQGEKVSNTPRACT